jgi:dephospho-CoA kinase
MVIGITGPFASGKSLASEFFRIKGWLVIDVDKLGHEALRRKNIISSLVREFGRNILNSSGEIDRQILGALVFKHRAKKKYLEDQVHGWMKKEVHDKLNQTKDQNVVIDAALLFQMKLDKWCSKIILVTAPEKLLIERAMKRDSLTKQRVQDVLKTQSFNKESCDYLVNNNGDLIKLMAAMQKIEPTLSRKK